MRRIRGGGHILLVISRCPHLCDGVRRHRSTVHDVYNVRCVEKFLVPQISKVCVTPRGRLLWVPDRLSIQLPFLTIGLHFVRVLRGDLFLRVVLHVELVRRVVRVVLVVTLRPFFFGGVRRKRHHGVHAVRAQ